MAPAVPRDEGTDARPLDRPGSPLEAAMAMLQAELIHGKITQRGVDKCLKLAWTLADLEEMDQPDIHHAYRAVEMREHQLQREEVA